MRLSRSQRVTLVFAGIILGYVGMQAYLVARAYADLSLPSPALLPLSLWVVVMTLWPALQALLERAGWHRAAIAGGWVGYSWMGFVFLFFFIALALDLLGLAIGATVAAAPAGATAYTSALRSFPLATGLTLAVAAYGFVDARRLRIEHVRLASSKPAPGENFRVALISDVHLGALVGRRRLRGIIERLERLDVDVVVSAGDLVDGLGDRLGGLAPTLAALRPRRGKYAVTGNHEYYVGLDTAADFHAQAGFTVLHGAAVDISERISIAGVDDPTGRRMGRAPAVDEHELLRRIPRERFTILLKHQPVIDTRAEGLFDLQLSGHVHKGQIFPFGLLVRLVYRLPTGLTRLAAGGWVYVSRGTGTWGPPIRVAAPPEITLIEIQRKKGSESF